MLVSTAYSNEYGPPNSGAVDGTKIAEPSTVPLFLFGDKSIASLSNRQYPANPDSDPVSVLFFVATISACDRAIFQILTSSIVPLNTLVFDRSVPINKESVLATEPENDPVATPSGCPSKYARNVTLLPVRSTVAAR